MTANHSQKVADGTLLFIYPTRLLRALVAFTPFHHHLPSPPTPWNPFLPIWLFSLPHVFFTCLLEIPRNLIRTACMGMSGSFVCLFFSEHKQLIRGYTTEENDSLFPSNEYLPVAFFRMDWGLMSPFLHPWSQWAPFCTGLILVRTAAMNWWAHSHAHI